MERLDTYHDKKLFLQIAEENELAFKKLFDSYKLRFYSVAFKMTRSEVLAEEIVQEVFMAIWLRRSQLHEIETPSTYLFTMLYNSVYAHFKKIALEKRVREQVINNVEQANNDTEEWFELKESRQLIDKAVSQLPAQQSKVYHLSREQGLSRQEIAEHLNISPNTVKNHLQEALKSIRAYLQAAGGLAIVTLSIVCK